MSIFELVETPSKAPSSLVFKRDGGESGYSEEGLAFLNRCYFDTGIADSVEARLRFWESYLGASSWSHDVSVETKLGACELEFIGKLYPDQVHHC